MRYLLDTCVISDFIKGEVGTTTKPNKLHLLILPSQQLQSWNYITVWH